MFPKNAGDADPKNGNVKAGTTIDTDIVSPFQFDWYTQSHASLLGTGRSAHYTVLVDDSRMSADELQTITYHLCVPRPSRGSADPAQVLHVCPLHARRVLRHARVLRRFGYVPALARTRLTVPVCTRAALHLRDSFDDSSTIVSDRSGASAEQEADRKLQAWRQKLRVRHSTLVGTAADEHPVCPRKPQARALLHVIFFALRPHLFSVLCASIFCSATGSVLRLPARTRISCQF